MYMYTYVYVYNIISLLHLHDIGINLRAKPADVTPAKVTSWALTLTADEVLFFRGWGPTRRNHSKGATKSSYIILNLLTYPLVNVYKTMENHHF